ncbi:hypothetical protein HBI56_229240 [Parastagonospora nodorum]|nr:hypothetical protein HBH52_122880 [Parastagonospora nodorum]KAH3984394.1 hypothetical protein HBH51_025920 [Parastagonospora nodorum]KAH4000639.1 hypothetical protein HBI10_098700 [Parastagonospora nodorum]KAH4026801.1 hypothetical protein HBI13_066900 [Parastagonospora nodorum]KAH4089727.1 hypothetical protein HBH46_192470 [Parastagonospora nodorum]
MLGMFFPSTRTHFSGYSAAPALSYTRNTALKEKEDGYLATVTRTLRESSMFYELVDIPQHMSMYGVIRWSFEPHCSLFDRRNELTFFFFESTPLHPFLVNDRLFLFH